MISRRKKPGYTMVEIMVILSIIVVLSSIVLSSFPRFTDNGALLNAQQTLATDLRRLQNISIAVAQVKTPTGYETAHMIGLHFDISQPKQYFFFVDENTNGKFDGLDQQFSPTVMFGRGVTVAQVEALGGPQAGNQYPSSVDIIFISPQADISISPNGQSEDPGISAIRFDLMSPSTPTHRWVTVWKTGQVALEQP